MAGRQTQRTENTPTATRTPLEIVLPEPSVTFEQGDERCSVRIDGTWHEIRFHDYDKIFEIDGLYEQLFYEVLKCQSPTVVGDLLAKEIKRAGQTASDLRALDLGAGNGLMGEELVQLGVERVVGVDILPEAARAAEQDHPDIYREYHVLDISSPSPEQREGLVQHHFTALTCIAALGFDDIPPTAFTDAFNLVEVGGWIAFTLKETFLSEKDSSGFARLVHRCIEGGVLDLRASERYQHRLSSNGSPLYYTAMVGIKKSHIPDQFVPTR